MKIARFAASLGLAILVVSAAGGCVPAQDTARPPARQLDLREVPMPSPLVPGPAAELPTSATTPRTIEESNKLVVIRQWRYAAPEQAASALGFVPRLPAYTAGAKLQYLLTKNGPGAADPKANFFTALYTDRVLTIQQWRGATPLGTKGFPASAKVRGVAASVKRTVIGTGKAREDLADIVWVEGGVNYHLWFRGPTAVALKIAASIPRR